MKAIRTAIIALWIGAASLFGGKAIADNVKVSHQASGQTMEQLVNTGSQSSRYEIELGKLRAGFDQNYNNTVDRAKASYPIVNGSKVNSKLCLYEKGSEHFIIGDFTSIDLGKGFNVSLYGETAMKDGETAKQWLSQYASGKVEDINFNAATAQYGTLFGSEKSMDHAEYASIDFAVDSVLVYAGAGRDLNGKVTSVIVINGQDKAIFAIPQYDAKTRLFRLRVIGATGRVNNGTYSAASGTTVLDDEVFGNFLPIHYSTTPAKSQDGLVTKLDFKTSDGQKSVQTLLGYGFRNTGFAVGPETVSMKGKDTQAGIVVETYKTGKVPFTTAKGPLYTVEFKYNSNTKKMDAYFSITQGL
jgi:hypothetical protein